MAQAHTEVVVFDGEEFRCLAASFGFGRLLGDLEAQIRVQNGLTVFLVLLRNLTAGSPRLPADAALAGPRWRQQKHGFCEGQG